MDQELGGSTLTYLLLISIEDSGRREEILGDVDANDRLVVSDILFRQGFNCFQLVVFRMSLRLCSFRFDFAVLNINMELSRQLYIVVWFSVRPSRAYKESFLKISN